MCYREGNRYKNLTGEQRHYCDTAIFHCCYVEENVKSAFVVGFSHGVEKLSELEKKIEVLEEYRWKYEQLCK